MELDKIIKEQLKKERETYLKESLDSLSDIEDNGFFLESYIDLTVQLMNEGYDIKEIEVVAEQGIMDKLTSGAGAIAKDTWDSTNVLQTLLGGSMSTIKEQMINWLLVTLGMGKGAANFMAAFLADYDIRDLLLMFKSKEHCMQQAPKVSDSLMEAVVRYLQFGEKETYIKQDYVKLGVGNMFGEIIRNSNIGETVANKFCGIIWK